MFGIPIHKVRTGSKRAMRSTLIKLKMWCKDWNILVCACVCVCVCSFLFLLFGCVCSFVTLTEKQKLCSGRGSWDNIWTWGESFSPRAHIVRKNKLVSWSLRVCGPLG
jgi:hypothetical protein